MWRAILGWPGYEVSECGEVRDVRGRKLPKLLKQASVKGYRLVRLVARDGRSQRKMVHRLVAIAFIGEPADPTFEVAHLDGNGENNTVQNLKWCSHRDNIAMKVDHGTIQSGDRHYASVKDEIVAELVAKHVAGMSPQDLSREYSIHVQTVRRKLREAKRLRPSWMDEDFP